MTLPSRCTSFGAAAILASLAWAGQAAAQDVVGRAVVNGEKVELLSDFTWRPADEAQATATGCGPVHTRLSFCGNLAEWKVMPSPNPQTAAMYMLDDRNFAQIIVEDIGADDGLSDAAVRNAILTNAAAASGVPANQIPVLDSIEATVDGQPAETIVFQAEVNGLSVVFMNTFVVQPQWNAQLLTFSVGPEYDDADRGLHEEFLGLVRAGQ